MRYWRIKVALSVKPMFPKSGSGSVMSDITFYPIWFKRNTSFGFGRSLNGYFRKKQENLNFLTITLPSLGVVREKVNSVFFFFYSDRTLGVGTIGATKQNIVSDLPNHWNGQKKNKIKTLSLKTKVGYGLQLVIDFTGSSRSSMTSSF